MASYHVWVNKALTVSQQDLIDHKEHCSADPEKLATAGLALGHQLRIKRNDSQYALYTVSQVRQEIPDNIRTSPGGSVIRFAPSSRALEEEAWADACVGQRGAGPGLPHRRAGERMNPATLDAS